MCSEYTIFTTEKLPYREGSENCLVCYRNQQENINSIQMLKLYLKYFYWRHICMFIPVFPPNMVPQ